MNFGYFQPVIFKNVNILHLRWQDRVLKPFGHFKHVVSDHYNKCGHFLSGVAIFCEVWTFFMKCGHFLWSMDIFCRVWSVVTTISVDIFVECRYYDECGHFFVESTYEKYDFATF